MPTFRHGKLSAVLWAGIDLSSYLNEASVSQDLEPAETTTFGGNAKTYIPGLLDGTASLSGLFDGTTGAVDEVMSGIGAEAPAAVIVAVSGGRVVGRRALLFQAHEASYEVSSPVADMVTIAVEAQATGGVRAGYIAGVSTAQAASAGTVLGTSVDLGAAGTNGRFALNVTANTLGAAGSVYVQTSTDNSTFADAGTIAVSAGVNAGTWGTVSSFNRYVRARTVYGGATGALTFTLAFSN
jgi:hypothetical protein